MGIEVERGSRQHPEQDQAPELSVGKLLYRYGICQRIFFVKTSKSEEGRSIGAQIISKTWVFHHLLWEFDLALCPRSGWASFFWKQLKSAGCSRRYSCSKPGPDSSRRKMMPPEFYDRFPGTGYIHDSQCVGKPIEFGQDFSTKDKKLSRKYINSPEDACTINKSDVSTGCFKPKRRFRDRTTGFLVEGYKTMYVGPCILSGIEKLLGGFSCRNFLWQTGQYQASSRRF